MSATDVEFGQDDAVRAPDIGHRGDHPPDDFAVDRRVGDLGADVAIQAHQLQGWLGQNAFGGFCRPVVDADVGVTRIRPVAAGALRTRDRRPPSASRPRCGRLRRRRGAQFVDGRRASVQDDPGRIDTGRQCGRQLAAGADADTYALLRDPAGDVGGQQRLCGIDDFDAGSAARWSRSDGGSRFRRERMSGCGIRLRCRSGPHLRCRGDPARRRVPSTARSPGLFAASAAR